MDFARQQEIRLLQAQKARLEVREGNLLRYIQQLMPDPSNLDDPMATRYETTPQAQLLCQVMEKVERGELKRVAVSIGPQLGKSQIISRAFPAYATGRDPYRNLMLGTYNQDFADEFGSEVRTIIQSPEHRAIFPDHRLTKGQVDLLVSQEGGKTAFVGVGGSGTGKPADFFVVDDPIRSDEDANSAVYREKIWKWFNSVVFTRCHEGSGIVVVHTRWHTDDLIGRLCDPDHPERNKMYKGIADDWTYINLPAVVTDPKLAEALGLTLKQPEDQRVIDQFGNKPMSALWEGRKGLPFLAEAKRMDARVFNALYMGKPTGEDGEFFKKEWLVEYDAEELPPFDELRIFGASDHAVSTKQDRDYTVAGCVGVDKNDVVWFLPDIVWERMETDRTVEELLAQFANNRPELWWMEDELISKSFGPFLKAEMIKRRIFTTLDPIRPSKDKRTRARAAQGRMALKRFRFPRFAPWWADAKSQLLRFDRGANDDFVDFVAHIGNGVLKELGPSRRENPDDNIIEVGSPVWTMRQTARRVMREKRELVNEGF